MTHFIILGTICKHISFVLLVIIQGPKNIQGDPGVNEEIYELVIGINKLVMCYSACTDIALMMQTLA